MVSLKQLTSTHTLLVCAILLTLLASTTALTMAPREIDIEYCNS